MGPVLLRHLLDRGLPPGMEVADGGTSGMDVAFRMRGAGHVILVDACTSGGEPGTLYELPGEEVESPPLEALGNLHSFRWDHAISFGRWLLKDEYPERVTAFLIEAATTDPGMELSDPVRDAMERLIDLLLVRYSSPDGGLRAESSDGRPHEVTSDGGPSGDPSGGEPEPVSSSKALGGG